MKARKRQRQSKLKIFPSAGDINCPVLIMHLLLWAPLRFHSNWVEFNASNQRTQKTVLSKFLERANQFRKTNRINCRTFYKIFLFSRFCDDLEQVFSATVLVQFLASVSAICVSSFLISLVRHYDSLKFSFYILNTTKLFCFRLKNRPYGI